MINASQFEKLHRQCGSALVMSLLIMFLLSMLGDSAIRSATLETVLVSNAVQARDVFQAAESSTQEVLNDTQNLVSAIESSSSSILIDTQMQDNTGLESHVVLRFISRSNASGTSLNAMQGASSFDALHFVAEGTAKIDSVNASRRIDQGIMRIAPAS